MRDLPGPGLEPVSPALASGFLTTVPPGNTRPRILYPAKMSIKCEDRIRTFLQGFNHTLTLPQELLVGYFTTTGDNTKKEKSIGSRTGNPTQQALRAGQRPPEYAYFQGGEKRILDYLKVFERRYTLLLQSLRMN